MKTFAGVVGAVLAFMALVWFVQGNDFFLYRTFAPKYEQVRRETFEQSKAFNQGTVQELQNMQFQYEQADDSHKAALRSLILHRAADYDATKMPPSLASFVSDLRRAR